MHQFFGHSFLGMLYLVWGAWHLICVLYNYAQSTTSYEAKIWHPFPGRFRCLELYFLAMGFLFIILYELTVDMDFAPFDARGNIPFKYLFVWPHVAMLFIFLLLVVVILLNDQGALPLPPGSGHLLAGVAFAAEFFVYAQYAADKTDLKGQLHRLLSYVVFVCMVTSFLQAWKPRSFLLDISNSLAIVFQGTWLQQMAFSIFVEAAIPLGCTHMVESDYGDGSTPCENPNATARAIAVMNLAFNWHILAILVTTLTLHTFVISKFGSRRKGYEVVRRHEANVDNDMEVLVSL